MFYQRAPAESGKSVVKVKENVLLLVKGKPRFYCSDGSVMVKLLAFKESVELVLSDLCLFSFGTL